MSISITYLLIMVILGIFLPINGILSEKKIKRFFDEHPNSRIIFFKQTIVIQTILTALVLASLTINKDILDVIGIGFIKVPIRLIGITTACMLGWLMIHIFLKHRNKEKLIKNVERDKEIIFLLPTSDIELRWAISASFTVGVCEEILYRGFFYWQLAQIVPVIPALLITNIIFGLVHYATGFKNAFLAFLLGLILSIIFVYTGSLWIPILIHILTDVFAMTRGRRYFAISSKVGH